MEMTWGCRKGLFSQLKEKLLVTEGVGRQGIPCRGHLNSLGLLQDMGDSSPFMVKARDCWTTRGMFLRHSNRIVAVHPEIV